MTIDRTVAGLGRAGQPRGLGWGVNLLGRVLRGKALARVGVLGLTLGLSALAGLALWSSSSTAEATGRVRQVDIVSDEWGKLLLNVSIEYDALSDYLRTGPEVGQRLISAMGSGEPNLQWLIEHGEAEDVAQAEAVRETYRAFTDTLRLLLDAGSRGDGDLVDALADQATLGAGTLRKQAVANGIRKRLEMREYLSEVDEHNRQLRLAAKAICGVDFCLLVLCGLVLFTHQRRTERQAIASRHQALHDGLTGVANRTLLSDRVEQALRAAKRHAEPVGLLLLDLNRFKEINDTLGHHCGDLLLKETARRLNGVMRDCDTVARLGGDEFAVLLPRITSPEHCMEVANRVREALQAPVDLDGVVVDVSASIGAAVYPTHSSTATELLQHADIAMYTAKRGRLGCALYDAEANPHSSAQLALLTELRHAIEGGELILHYQPKVQTATSRLCGAEALVRWRHPTRGLLVPADFIPQAEESELILPLTDYVLDAALEQHREWRRAGLSLPVAVNVATRCLLDRQFPDRVAALLAEHEVPPGELTLEITESAVISDPARTSSVLARLRGLGVRLAIDDFGTGYSSMAYLQTMPLHELKIDRRFVTEVHSARNKAIVRAILELAHALDLEVVAEGVEDEQTLDTLDEMGCDAAQGYHMCRPVPASDLLAWAANRPDAQSARPDAQSPRPDAQGPRPIAPGPREPVVA